MLSLGLEPMGQAHPRQQRLRRKADFDQAFARGWRSSDSCFSVVARRNDAGVARLGLAVSVKAAGGGVARNRLKRLAREAFRQCPDKPALDFVVTARAGVAGQANPALRASLDQHLRALIQRAAATS